MTDSANSPGSWDLLKNLEKLEDRFEDPDPELIAGRIAQFGRVLKGFLLPLADVNALLIGCILYHRAGAGDAAQVGLAALSEANSRA